MGEKTQSRLRYPVGWRPPRKSMDVNIFEQDLRFSSSLPDRGLTKETDSNDETYLFISKGIYWR
jgi:hypothetical protein